MLILSYNILQCRIHVTELYTCKILTIEVNIRKKSLTGVIFPMNESPVCVLVCVCICVCAVVPRASGRLHPAGVGEGSRVSMGQQPRAGGRVSVASGESLQSAGRDSQPRPLWWVNKPVAPTVCCFRDKPASSRFAGQTNCWPQPDLCQQKRKTFMTLKKNKPLSLVWKLHCASTDVHTDL